MSAVLLSPTTAPVVLPGAQDILFEHLPVPLAVKDAADNLDFVWAVVDAVFEARVG